MSRRKIGRWALPLLLVAAACVQATPASATTFSGSCHLTGHIDYEQPLTLILSPKDFQSYLSGTCTGTLDGKAYDGPASSYTDGRMGQPASCLAGEGREMLSVLQFGGSPGDVDAVRLDNYTTLDLNVLNVAPFAWRGAYNGQGVGYVSVANGGQEQFQQCAGPGLSRIDIDVQESTVTPMYG
jgi:hypothetical protein